MNRIKLSEVKEAATIALLKASTSFSSDQIEAYERAIERETEQNAKWILEMTLENAIIAKKNRLPLCDDTGIPHVLLEIGNEVCFDGFVGNLLKTINDGIAKGLRDLPARPMAVCGNDLERLTQCRGLFEDPGMLLSAPIRVKECRGEKLRLTVLMLGGG
eukprot:CAMPEP_0201284674 /NCGR_PEP_ID=MMETSP1317-20130820/81133_1 /ASSEMBLY_ACC=CAM_ASM_000770 /TAXON_ID=187299 /ORGANISM="Undescribed Undescribed, Strain Undescribed" /LENGTH=159 /DNA_ID=CAMNT_0047605769 /DNA_START=54 /DNA_END=529 /DNA_ORIENTATION=-